VIDWPTIFGGAPMSAVAAGVVLVALGCRAPAELVPGVTSSFVAPVAWNAILHRTGGRGLDIPFKAFPVSWQDTGSGVFTLALTSTSIGLSAARAGARRVVALSLACAAAAFVVDIYLY